MNYGLILFTISFIITSCSPRQSSDKTSVSTQVKEVEQFIDDYYEVMSARDWSTYQALFSERATLTTIWADSIGQKNIFTSTISEFVAQTAEGPDSQPIFEEKPIHKDIQIEGDLASAWVKYEAKFGNEKELMEWTGYDLFSLLQHKNKWYITSISYVSDD